MTSLLHLTYFAAGAVKKDDESVEEYYDTFATVLLPETFVYSVENRLTQTSRPEEDTSYIISDSFRHKDLLQWFKQQGKDGSTSIATARRLRSTSSGTNGPSTSIGSGVKPVEVRSCFGGLGIYRSSTWFEKSCNYQVSNPHDFMVGTAPLTAYANQRDRRACEHVAFHECVRNANPNIKIAVQPDLQTRWKRTPRRPQAVVHVGPHKTGTTAIQSSFRKYSKDVKKDSYEYLLRGMYFGHCLVGNAPEGQWKEKCQGQPMTNLQNQIRKARSQKKNIVVSSESLDRTDKQDPDKMRQILPEYEIHVVVTYRRFYDWIVSLAGQIYRMNHGMGWDAWPAYDDIDSQDDGHYTHDNIVTYLSPETIQDVYERVYTTAVYDSYRSAGYETHLLNYHSSEDIVESFFCLDYVNMTHACSAKKADTTVDAPKANRAESSTYDEIVVAAYRAGLLFSSEDDDDDVSSAVTSTTNSTSLHVVKREPIASRAKVREMLQGFVEGSLGYSEESLPKVCVPDGTVNLLREISLSSEAALLPTFHESENGRESLLSDFESYKTTKFCSVDAKKVLELSSIQTFFSNLRKVAVAK